MLLLKHVSVNVFFFFFCSTFCCCCGVWLNIAPCRWWFIDDSRYVGGVYKRKRVCLQKAKTRLWVFSVSLKLIFVWCLCGLHNEHSYIHKLSFIHCNLTALHFTLKMYQRIDTYIHTYICKSVNFHTNCTCTHTRKQVYL